MFPYIIAFIVVFIFLFFTMGFTHVSRAITLRAHNKHVAWMTQGKLTGYVLGNDTYMGTTVDAAYEAHATYGGPLTIVHNGHVYDHAY